MRRRALPRCNRNGLLRFGAMRSVSGLARSKLRNWGVRLRSTRPAAGFSTLTEIYGVGLVVAGTLAGILGPGCRFRTDAALAAYAGAAPLETSSAGLVRQSPESGWEPAAQLGRSEEHTSELQSQSNLVCRLL